MLFVKFVIIIFSDFFKKKEKESLSKVISRMTAKDGIPFAKFCTSEDLRRAITALGFKQPFPTSAHGIRNMVIQYSMDVRTAHVAAIADTKAKAQKFCITFDEWTSSRKRRYMNIFLSTLTELWNLGLLPIKGSLTSKRAVEMVTNKLNIYKVTLLEDVICVITNGTNAMKKIGRLVPCNQQLCLAHAIQLAVLDVLYKKRPTVDEDPFDIAESEPTDPNDELSPVESDEDETDDELLEFTVFYDDFSEISHLYCGPVIDKVRKVVKMYGNSPLKSENLAMHTRTDRLSQRLSSTSTNPPTNKTIELGLLLDSKSRWNSLYTMLERFSKLQSSIMKSLIDIKAATTFEQNEWELITNLVEALEPVKVRFPFLKN